METRSTLPQSAQLPSRGPARPPRDLCRRGRAHYIQGSCTRVSAPSEPVRYSIRGSSNILLVGLTLDQRQTDLPLADCKIHTLPTSCEYFMGERFAVFRG